ncbi:MAG: gluconate transporter [Filimonas sp.]|nr:gluconate transporter [Filimonas sp.]
MSIVIILLCIVLLILLITWGKVNTFLAFLIVSIVAGIALGMPLEKLPKAIQTGIGDTLGSLTVIIVLGAMLGKLVAESGAAQKIASVLVSAFGTRYIQWALMITGFIVGIPLYYGVGFILLVPLIFSIVYKYKLPAVYIGLPMLSALSVTHGYLPPHPSPVALVTQFKADMGLTLIYGLIVAVPAIILAGPVFATSLKNITSPPLELFQQTEKGKYKEPGKLNSFLTTLLPVFLLILFAVLQHSTGKHVAQNPVLTFISDPAIVMLITLIVATFTLGTQLGRGMKAVMDIYGDAVKDIAMILLIIAGSGILKQVMTDSGVSATIAQHLQTFPVHPLILGWMIAAIIRACVGSATVAALTAAGVILPLMQSEHINPNLMVLAVGSGSLMFSHVNDSGFWLFKEYFNLSMKDTFRSWSIMEMIVSVVGLIGVLLLNLFL